MVYSQGNTRKASPVYWQSQVYITSILAQTLQAIPGMYRQESTRSEVSAGRTSMGTSGQSRATLQLHSASGVFQRSAWEHRGKRDYHWARRFFWCKEEISQVTESCLLFLNTHNLPQHGGILYALVWDLASLEEGLNWGQRRCSH